MYKTIKLQPFLFFTDYTRLTSFGSGKDTLRQYLLPTGEGSENCIYCTPNVMIWKQKMNLAAPIYHDSKIS